MQTGVVADTTLSMQVNLYISGRSLKDLDTFSKSDPCCRLYEKKHGQWVKIASTETINDNLNPDFEQALVIPYFFEKRQDLKFEIVDDDGSGSYDLIGSIETTMGAVMGAKKQMFESPLQANGSSNRGKIIVRAEAVQSSNFCARFRLRWQNLNNLSAGFIGIGRKRMTVRFEIGRQIPGTNKFAEIWCSRNFKQQSPDFDISMQQQTLAKLCNNNRDAKIRFSVWTKTGDKMINEVQISVNQIADGGQTIQANAGAQLVLNDWQIFERPTLVDYLRGGWGISVVGAIDYTASNGNPSTTSSLHYLGPNNQYESAIGNVGAVVEPYDNDRSFPFFGFGGIPRHMGINGISHCFAINGNPSNPEIQTMMGVIQTYRETLPQIGLGGPTLFGPLLEQFMSHVQATVQ